MNVLEGFAGPGGWSEGLRAVAPDAVAVGVELDPWACATARAAGHHRIQADVARFPVAHLRGSVDGIVLSPPCPTFSTAGQGEGRDELPWLHRFTEAWSRHGWRDPWDLTFWTDPRTPLVLEPLRWVEQIEPTWVALEQVPPVLELWEHFAAVLEGRGYRAWAGVLCAADWGVAQTRRRAILMAHRDRPVQPPEPTHCEGGGATLFGELAPWVSMADALGWGDGLEVDRRTNSRGPGGTVEPTVPVPLSQPSPTLTGIAGGQWVFRERQEHGARRTPDQPAPMITGSADNGNFAWVYERPATTVCGDPRLPPPGHRDREGGERQFDPTTTIKLTVEDALRLQSFRPDFPVQGPRSAQFLQVGNAVPPVMAAAILRGLL